MSSLTGKCRVWATSDTRHVRRGEPAGTGTGVALSGARGEWLSFQIFARATVPVAGMNVVPGDLTRSGGSKLRASQARLFRQHQLEVTTGTFLIPDFVPDWYPDALIPFQIPTVVGPTPGATVRAVPFDLPANQTHGFWVDVQVPTTAMAGLHRGIYTVTAPGMRPVAIHVTVTVWNFDMPATPTMQTAMGDPGVYLQKYYEDHVAVGAHPLDWTPVYDQFHQLLADHGVNATPDEDMVTPVRQQDGSYQIPPADVTALAEFVNRYHVNAIHVLHPRWIVGLNNYPAEKAKLDAWMAAFTQVKAALNRPGLTFYVYLADEPNTALDYEYVRKWGDALRATNSVVKGMVTEQDTPSDETWGDLYGAVDIWCPLFGIFDPVTAPVRRALGETFWAYTALVQYPTPSWHIDAALLNYRVCSWMAWRDHIQGLLYWAGMAWWQGVVDPWTEPMTYGAEPHFYNGEGTMVYPGIVAGYHGLAPSIRLKALRDGIQNYEYLAILDRLGKGDEARQIVESLTSSWTQWNTDPRAYDTARTALAQMIVAATQQHGGHGSHRQQELDGDIQSRPRTRSRLVTGTSRLHFDDRIASDPVSGEEDPTPRQPRRPLGENE